jgi:triosephosphate isomerase
MRTPVIAANWKMNTTIAEATALVSNMLTGLDDINGVEKILCPPFISLAVVADIIKGSSVKLGAQNMYFEEKGAYTGEISPTMLAGLCRYVIIGHSERRQYFGETDETINKKVKAALKAGITPILCVGENNDENEAGKTAGVVSRQVKLALADIYDANGAIIAYEPIWAIGTGKSASGEQANGTIGLIRRQVADIINAETAAKTPILYGGSVNADNIAEFVSQPDIDGALVGGASLKAGQFVSIVRQTAETRAKRL